MGCEHPGASHCRFRRKTAASLGVRTPFLFIPILGMLLPILGMLKRIELDHGQALKRAAVALQYLADRTPSSGFAPATSTNPQHWPPQATPCRSESAAVVSHSQPRPASRPAAC